MKKLVFAFITTVLIIPALLGAAELKPAGVTGTLQQQFSVSPAKPFSVNLNLTTPGQVTVDLVLKGGPVALYLRTANGKVLASSAIGQPSGRLSYAVTQADLQSGYSFNLALTTRAESAVGTLRAIYPKVEVRQPAITPLAQIRPQTITEKTALKPIMVKQPLVGPSATARAALANSRAITAYPNTGTDPVPDVTNWSPRTRVAAGGELIVQGRNLKPSQLNAYVGDTKLTATTQMAHEIRFKVPQGILNPGAPLAVYHQGGEVRTLEQAYSIYNPTVSIARVQPGTFSPGDVVTIYGTSLFDVSLHDSYYETRIQGTPLVSSINQVQKPGNFISVGNYKVQVLNPQVSATGDTLSFMVGSLFESGASCLRAGYGNCSTPDSIIWFLHPVATVPPSVLGDLKLRLKGSGATVNGSAVTWRPGGPKISKVYGRLFGKQEPFVILPTPEMGQYSAAGSAVVEGGNLYGATYRIGAMAITGYSMPAPTDGTKVWLNIPLNASSGQICGTPTNGAAAACSPTSLQTFGGPVITRAPTMPLALGVNHTIEGLNLLPPQIPGLTYTFKLFGHEATNPSSVACNEVMEIVQHTSTRIVFRIGDPAKLGVLPAGCGTGTEFIPPTNSTTTQYKMYLWAGYQGQNLGLWSQAYYLRPWDMTAAPKILKFEGRSEVGTIDAAKFGNSITTPVVLNLGTGKSATLSWDLGASAFDSADISGVGPVTSAVGSVTVTPASTQRYILSVRKAQALVQKAIDVYVAPPPQISSFDCISLVYPPPNGISYFKQGQGGELRWSVGYSWKLIEITPGPLYRTTRSATDANRADTGSRVVNPAQPTIYTITASNEFGSSSKSCTLAPLPPTRIAEYTITPSTIRKGESATLTWRLEGLAGRVSGRMNPTFLPSGSTALPSMDGSISISPQVSQSITLEAYGPDTTYNSFPSQTLTIQVTQ